MAFVSSIFLWFEIVLLFYKVFLLVDKALEYSLVAIDTAVAQIWPVHTIVVAFVEVYFLHVQSLFGVVRDEFRKLLFGKGLGLF